MTEIGRVASSTDSSTFLICPSPVIDAEGKKQQLEKNPQCQHADNHNPPAHQTVAGVEFAQAEGDQKQRRRPEQDLQDERAYSSDGK